MQHTSLDRLDWRELLSSARAVLPENAQEAEASLIFLCSSHCLDQLQNTKKAIRYESDPSQSTLPPDNYTVQETIAYIA